MKKNVAGQKVGAQMVTAADGTAFTATTLVYVTGDAGTQAIGSVSLGVCTHEGNGYHTYAPAQAETNYDLVAFTFATTLAIPSTVQIYTSYPQTGDAYVSITQVSTALTSSINAVATSVFIMIPALLATPIETNVSVAGALRLLTAAEGGKTSGMDTGSPIIRDVNDTKNRVTSTTDASGNRTAVTLDLT